MLHEQAKRQEIFDGIVGFLKRNSPSHHDGQGTSSPVTTSSRSGTVTKLNQVTWESLGTPGISYPTRYIFSTQAFYIKVASTLPLSFHNLLPLKVAIEGYCHQLQD